MQLLRIVIINLLLWAATASRPANVSRQTNGLPSCLKAGVWGNDWPLCGTARTVQKAKRDDKKKLEEELKLTLREDGSGEMSFYDCQKRERIPEPLQFSLKGDEERVTIIWKGDAKKVRESASAFNFQENFRMYCRKDTLFVDGLLQNTMYRGATYFLRRN